MIEPWGTLFDILILPIVFLVLFFCDAFLASSDAMNISSHKVNLFANQKCICFPIGSPFVLLWSGLHVFSTFLLVFKFP